MNRGSVWRKWDLHVHTPAAALNNQFKGTNEDEKWRKYLDKLTSLKDISVLGITDYFSIEGYEKVKAYKNAGNLNNIDLLLPNVELRILPVTSEDTPINLHIIFSPEIIDELDSKFFSSLEFTYQGEVFKCTRKDVIKLGGIFRGNDLQETTAYKTGIEQFKISFEKIREVIGKDKLLKENSIIVVSNKSSDGVSGIQHSSLAATREEIYRFCDCIFSANPNDREYFLGRGADNLGVFIRKYGTLKPCIHGSDAHSFEKLCKPDKDRFCWIKADPTFEGLKQIIYEPEERVRIQPENPEYRKNIYTLDSLKISNSWISNELSIGEQEVLLNRNLIAVTGGKGSGKTALLDLIANCFEDRCKKRAAEDKNSFVQRIEDQKEDLEVEIGFVGKDIEEFSKELIEENFFQDTRITYLPQGKIEEYSGDREKLDKKIEEIIFSNKEVTNEGYKQKFDGIRNEIDVITKEIDKINRGIYEFEEDTKGKIIAEITGKQRIKEGELKDKKDELRRLTESMEVGIKESIEKLKGEETKLRIKHSKLEGVKTKLEQFESELAGFLDVSNKTISDLNHELLGLMINSKIPQLDFKPQLDVIKKVLELIPQRIEDVTTKIEEKKGRLGQLSGVEKTHAEILKEMEGIKADIESLGKQLKQLEEKKEEIKSLETERMGKYNALLSKYREWREYYEEVIEVFSTGKNEIMSGIDFKSNIYFNKDQFIELGLDILDQRSIKRDEVEKYAALLETVISENTLDRLQEFIQKIFEYKNFLKETRTSYDFYKWIFDNYFSLSTGIFFNGTSINKLSMGQKGMVLLKLFLAEGDYPLIVDQPEESLDNKFIYNELVGAFREAKKERQILIATNNANLVVNTDTEQIIIAEFENNKISYKLGTLEDLKMREDIMPILEGGKEAFKKREEKYGI